MDEKFKNLIITGAYASDEELGKIAPIVIIIALIFGLGYWIFG